MSQDRILIVDDDPALLTALSGALTLRIPELIVESCDSAFAAIERISDTEYDAVVTDIKMPGMDGLALLHEIRRLQPDLPTLLITGHGQHDLAVQALRGGAFDFIQKPIDRDYVVASLNRAIRMRKMHRQLQEQQEALANHAADLERAVAERTEQLHQANRRKDEFLATLSHELRNPLSPIRSGLDILEMEGHGDPDIIRLMQEQIEHVVRLVDDLTDTARIMQGKIELRKLPVDLHDLIDQSVNTLKSQFEDRNHEVVLCLSKEPIRVNADPVRIVQIVENLLGNAAKYTDPGGRIELSTRVEGSQAVIAVKDDGIGIDAELLPNIFELFTQSPRSLDRSQGGLGIGLALVHRLVEMHQGSITAVSEGPGEGSTFMVRLPVLTGQPESGIFIEAPSKQTGKQRRILVVDDNAYVASMLSMSLTRLGGHEVQATHDGPSALAMLPQFDPEFVLIDIGLPGMNGFELARTIRETPEFQHLRLIAVTGYGRDADRINSKDAGFDKHLVKPINTEELENALNELQNAVY